MENIGGEGNRFTKYRSWIDRLEWLTKMVILQNVNFYESQAMKWNSA